MTIFNSQHFVNYKNHVCHRRRNGQNKQNIIYSVYLFVFLSNRAEKIATGLPNNGKPKGTSPTPCEKHNGFFKCPLDWDYYM